MALLDTDILAVYRADNQTNYKATVSQIVARVLAPTAPALNAVLSTGNTSNNIDIIIQDGNSDPQVTLRSADPSLFSLGLHSYGDVKVGQTVKTILGITGDNTTNRFNLCGDSGGIALQVFEVGTTVDNVSTQTPVATINNDGTATFTGALEAASIDGGVYAT